MNNVYGSVVVPPNVPTIVVGLTVPPRSAYSLLGLIIWSEVDNLIEVRLNGVIIGGGRISGAVQTLFLDYSASPFGLQAQWIVTVLALQNDSLTPSGSYPVSATLLVEQL